MKRIFPFVLPKSGTLSYPATDKSSTAKPASDTPFLKRDRHAILCAGFLLLLTPASYLRRTGLVRQCTWRLVQARMGLSTL